MQLMQTSQNMPGASLEELYKRSNLTQRQLLMWIGQKLQMEKPDFNMPSLFAVDGHLDETAFCRAVQALVQSSDCLRTVIREHEGVPRQQVLEQLDASVEIVDLSLLSDPHTRLMELVRERALRPFGLHRKLFRFALFHLGAERSAWFVNVHHIIADGCSMRLLFNHLSDLYQDAVSQDRAPTPLALPPFTDYVAAERAYSQTDEYARDREYWAARTAEVEPTFFYGGQVPTGSSSAHRVRLDLGVERTRRLRALAEAHGNFWGTHSAMQNLLAAVLFTLVHRVGPNAAPSVAMAFHNRGKSFQDTMGLLMQTLPIRVCLADNDSFYTLMERVTEACLEALEHRGCAVANPLHRRVWEVVLNYLPTEFGAFAGFTIDHQWIFPQHVNAALTVTVHDFTGSGTVSIDFDLLDGAFDESDRELVARHFVALLDAMLDDIDASVHQVDILTVEEKRVLLPGASGDAPSPSRTYVQCFEDTARRRGSHTAVRVRGKNWSYTAVNAAANQLARHLRDLGVGPGQWVGIYLVPGIQQIIAILGVLKAGGAYLPLETSYPIDRLRFMLEDGNARVVVTQEDLYQKLPVRGRQVLIVDREAEVDAIHRHASLDLPCAATLDDFAYIIYTSGSTGRPKGVRIQHRALAGFLEAARGTWVAEDDVLPFTSPLSFDLHIGDLLLPLAVGATVVPVAREVAAEGLRFKAELERMEPTAFFATPATFRMLVDAGWRGRPGLKLVCGGEVLAEDLARELLARTGSLLNVYGPSETTCYVLTHQVEVASPAIPIGRPLRGVRIYVSDRHGMLVPRGIPGELVIGGPQVGYDYLNQPQLTAEKFISDRYSSVANARAYRSGDLARYAPDGTVIYLGRIDHQVKIRGYRIELGEIEHLLSRHGGVRQSLVMAREDAPGDGRLVAYLVCADGAQSVDTPALREYLRQYLPEFMVPSAYILLEEFPITPNGKIDRSALPAPKSPRSGAEETEVPRDLLQFQITKMFEDALGIQPVGIHDNFFELGGNSLRAVRLMASLERVLDRQLPSLMTVFETPTPHQLAAVLSRDGWQPALPAVVPLQPRGDSPPFFCVHAFIGDVCRDLGRHCGIEHPFYGLQPRGLDGREEPIQTIPEMARFYIQEMRKVQPQGPYFLGGYSFGGLVAVEMATQLREAGNEVALLAVIDAAPLNMRPRSFRGKARALLNAPLILLEKVHRLFTQEPPQRLLHTLHSKIKSRLLHSLVQARGTSNLNEPRSAVALVERMYGMSRWPKNYQRIARINLLAMMRHVPRPYDGRLTFIRRQAPLHRFAFERPDWGWSELVPRVEVHYVPGNHDEIMVEPVVGEVGAIIQQCLRRARQVKQPELKAS